MTPTFANARKYYFSRACGLIYIALFLLAASMWAFRNFEAGQGLLCGYFLFPFLVGVVVGFVEQITIETTLVWTLPGHLRAVRKLLVWIACITSLPVPLVLAVRDVPLTALQLAAIGFMCLMAFGTGLVPRLFGRQAIYIMPAAPMTCILTIILTMNPVANIRTYVEQAVLESSGLVVCLGVAVCVFCWRRLGDRGPVRALVNASRLNLVDLYDADKQAEYRRQTRPVKESDWTFRAAARLQQWLFGKVRKARGSATRRLILGSLLQALEPRSIAFLSGFSLLTLVLLLLGSLDAVRQGSPILSAVLTAVLAAPMAAITGVFLLVWAELCYRVQGPLLLPSGRRRDLLRARWIYLGGLFAFGLASASLLFAINDRAGSWISHVGLIALAAPTMAAVGFIVRIYEVKHVVSAVFASVFVLIFVAILIAFLWTLPLGWLWALVALIWVVMAPLLRDQTLTEDSLW